MGFCTRWPALRTRLRLDDFAVVRWLNSGAVLARIGGWLFRAENVSKTFRPVHKLRRFGPRTGRGVRHHGIVETRNGRIIYGEYFRNSVREPVRLYASDDDGQSWYVLHEFPAGDIRHVHGLAEDPYTGHLFLMTGDLDFESRIAETSDGGKSFRTIGTGSQSWRTCDLLFTREAVLWSVDSGHLGYPGIWRWDRASEKAECIAELDGASEFGTLIEDDLSLFTVCRNGFECEWDEHPSLWVSDSQGASRRLTFDLVRGRKAVQTGLRLVASPSKKLVGLTVSNTSRYPFASFWAPAARFAEALYQSSSVSR
jgi:hypothetical protein